MSQNGQFLKQIDRLVNSSVLHGSESLCKLLRYLAQHALDHTNAPLKEYQIATEVFGRPADFDPQLDSAIRVQAGRLRTKLTEYYAAEGVGDPIVVELPKGTYHLAFPHRAPAEHKVHGPVTSPPSWEPVPATQVTRNWKVAWVATLVVLVAAVTTIAAMVIRRNTTGTALAARTEIAPNELQTFWEPFVSSPEEPWVIFSNAAFIGRPETGMRYYNSARDGQGQVWDHYTGVGEVLGMHSLDQAFSALHRQIRVKRGSLFSLDDAKNNDLIFIGSPSENLSLQDLPSTREFVFQRMASGSRKGDLAIVNMRPKPGEPDACLASPSGAPLTEDYFVIGFMPGLNPARSVLILAGTTTFGTQAAAEYVSRESSLKDLLAKLAVDDSSQIQPFEALVRVKIVRGVPVETELLAVHQRR